MGNEKIKDIKISLKIIDSTSKQEIAKESKELTLLSYETKLNDADYINSCYSKASHEENNIPYFKDIRSLFIDHCLQLAITNASIFIATPDGTYPLIEINKKPIDSTHREITLQRIEQHLLIQTNEYFELLNERILQYLIDNNMIFVSEGNLVNDSVVEVW